MLEKILEWSATNRLMVLLAAIILSASGIYAVANTSLDAIPDLSDVQVIVYADYEGQAPQVVEDQVTYPLSTAMLSVPKAKIVRGYSFFGISFIYIIFDDDTDLYWARSRVLEQLASISGALPEGVSPALGPDATGVGWVFQYALVDKSGKHDISELRSIQDWYLKYELQTVPGVAEVASLGGFVKQYQVEVDPNRLLAFNLSIIKVRDAIKRSNMDSGGRLLEMAETEFMVRGKGYLRGIEDIENIMVSPGVDGTPIFLKELATVRLGPELRRGVTDLNGEGDTATGVVIMRFGENALAVIEAVKERLKVLSRSLPEGVEIVTTYDRSDLILRAVDFLEEKLIEEMVLVSLISLLFLMHFRSALVAVLSLPVGVLAAFLVMRFQGINANIMSLGGIAIAIGAMVDGAVVMIENAHKQLEHNPDRDRVEVIIDSVKEVGPSLFFCLLIITVSFMPVFSLEAQEGRLFSPLAFTKTYSMAASAFLAITLVPVLLIYLVRGKIMPEASNPINRMLLAGYRPVAHFAVHKPGIVVAALLFLLASCYYPLTNTGSEFMPPLDEGDILYMPTALPGISITKSKELLQQTDRILKTFPEVELVFGKAGRAETATDPAPLSMFETLVKLKPREQWRKGMTMPKLIKEMNEAIQFPGLTNAWTMPIKTRLDMLATGIKTPVGIKIKGDSLQELQDVGAEMEKVLAKVPGTLSVYAERVVGGNYLDIIINRKEAARYGLSIMDVQAVIQSAIGGMNVTTTVEGRERYPVNLRYERRHRNDVGALKRMILPTKGGGVPLSQLAEIKIVKGPSVIKSEDARLNSYVYVDLSGSDVGGYVARAMKAVDENMTLPPSVSLKWSGQYEYMQRAAKKLKVVVPFTLFLIFGLLFMNFKNLGESLMVMLSIPFALVGSVWTVYLAGYNWSVAGGVGLIALAGVATEIGVLMVLFMRNEVNRSGATDVESFLEAVEHGAASRVRPIAMTAAAVIGGLLPILWSDGTGADLMKRIAAPMVGGMVTAVLISLLLVPALYSLFGRAKYRN